MIVWCGDGAVKSERGERRVVFMYGSKGGEEGKRGTVQ